MVLRTDHATQGDETMTAQHQHTYVKIGDYRSCSCGQCEKRVNGAWIVLPRLASQK